MGQSQSSHVSSDSKTNFKSLPESVRGRKSVTMKLHKPSPHGLRASIVSDTSMPDFEMTDHDHSSVEDDVDCDVYFPIEEVETDEESDEEIEFEDDEWNERLQILEETRKLKILSDFFLHPENPIQTSFSTRCYFDRFSSPERLSLDVAEMNYQVKEDLKALKQLAQDYLHPELPVVTSDPLASARCYFSGRSAVPTEDEEAWIERQFVLEDAHLLKQQADFFLHPENQHLTAEELEERERLLEDAKQLKALAIDYLHPELPVITRDPTSFARCFYNRPTAPQQDAIEDVEERGRILEDAKQRKASAMDYLHPERPVATSDPTNFARCFFDRPSAPKEDELEERERVLQEMKQLKAFALDYLHPERPVTSDPTIFARSYFDRPNAPREEELGERERVLEEMNQLKALALDYLHPERPVATSDPTVFARCFFGRPSAPQLEDLEGRERVLEEMKQLKAFALDYLHPERPVTGDPIVFARCFFERPSAPLQEDLEERERVLDDMKQLKASALDYLHPERPVASSDHTASARCFFERLSAPQREQLDEVEERDRVLEEVKQLKALALDYLHPERPVTTIDTASARCFFDRPSAPLQETPQELEERERIHEDVKQLKAFASDYLHPERPVTTSDPGRCFFDRPSALPQESLEELEERGRVLEETKQLKVSAVDYLHPERPVTTNDPALFARCFFDRQSAPPQETLQELGERERVLEEMNQLKASALDYLHPERQVTSSDSSVFARCFFNRRSAPQQETLQELDQRDLVLEDMKELKAYAVDYLHPEHPVTVSNPTIFARCFYNRSSAPQQETPEDIEERERILDDARQLKAAALDYLHPECPVITRDPTVFARCFYDRPSAVQQETIEELNERARIIDEANHLKTFAEDYLHPERPVTTSDPNAFARCFFDRPSALQQETLEEVEEHGGVLADAKQLKAFALDYLHPERPVTAKDHTVLARCYYDRPSALPQETQGELEERERVLEEAKQLKSFALDYLHPERPVVVCNSAVFARCFFDRPSAVEETQEELEEREHVLEDMKLLKAYAQDSLHPERPVTVRDPSVFARSYYDRPSALLQETQEELKERERVIEEAKQLKASALNYLHPETPVITSDPTLFARCLYDRASAPHQEALEDLEERERVLEESRQLKASALNYLHPERPVTFLDPTVFARCFYDRPSAVQQETLEEAEERGRVIDEANQLKVLADDYLHPERPVVVRSSAVFARCFYDRPSVLQQETQEQLDERERVLEEAKHLKFFAMNYLHPESPVTVSDHTVFARCFYDRPSALQQETQEELEERERVIEEAKQLKSFAVDYLHPEHPVTIRDPTVFARSFYSRPSAPQSESQEDVEERERVLEEIKQLKTYAMDYLHPELPVTATDPTVFARCFYDRPSAPQQEALEDLEERERIIEESCALKNAAASYLHPEIKVETSDATAVGRNYYSRPSAAGHHQMIHTFPPHDDDEHSEHHMDHFGMDEDMDMFADMRHELHVPEGPSYYKQDYRSDYKSDDESNLSRSPSSVMLFTGESMYD